MALAPLSSMLNYSRYGYTTQSLRKINHLPYMNDLKTNVENNKEQIRLLYIVKTFSGNIKMEFGLNKCPKASFVCGKLIAKENIQIYINIAIK